MTVTFVTELCCCVVVVVVVTGEGDAGTLGRSVKRESSARIGSSFEGDIGMGEGSASLSGLHFRKSGGRGKKRNWCFANLMGKTLLGKMKYRVCVYHL